MAADLSLCHDVFFFLSPPLEWIQFELNLMCPGGKATLNIGEEHTFKKCFGCVK